MSIITLTTDFGNKDYFVGALKGKILSQYPDAKIVDISHKIDLFNTFEASYCIEAAYVSFPKGTIHIIGVDAEQTKTNQHVVMQYDDHFFICADNGILNNLVVKKQPQKLVTITIHDRLQEDASDLDVFVAVACHLAKGGLLNVIGREIQNLKDITVLMPSISKDFKEIKGHVIYIDAFGNCVTNITKKIILELTRGREFEILIKNRKVTRIHKGYSDFKITENRLLKEFEGELLVLFNENGYLEIAIYKSNPKTIGAASTLLGLHFRDTIIIKIK
jgi:S-adenosylmethionine hydrolase